MSLSWYTPNYYMSSQYLNAGQSILNLTSNESYYQCDACYQSVNCVDPISNKQQVQFDTILIYLIIYSIELCLSFLNNLLSLNVFLGNKRVRRTNIGVYLTIYSIISIGGNALLVIDQYVQYFKLYPFANNVELSETFHCFLEKSGRQVTLFVCLWLNVLVAFEHGLIICFNFKMNATRWRSVVTLLFVFCVAAATSITMLIYRCEWNVPHKTLKVRLTSDWFYAAAFLAGLVYVLATLLVQSSFASRISQFGTTQQSKTKIFFELLKKHLFVFIPPITCLLCVIPYQIWFSLKGPTQTYFQCGISTVEYSFKVIVHTLPTIPTVITWFIFVHPSKVYMTEFYTETWVGRMWMRRAALTGFKLAQRSSQMTDKSDLKIIIIN
jgi:hypothetical protein